MSRVILSQVLFITIDALAKAAEVGDKNGKGKDLCTLIKIWAKIVVNLSKVFDSSIIILDSLPDLSYFFLQWIGLRAISWSESAKNTDFIFVIIN